MKKAFDMVDHEILIRTLEHYGVRGTAKDWFCLYLANRKQFVSINNHNFTIQTILTGVPQGSVLGPLLFLVCISDMYQYIYQYISILHKIFQNFYFTHDTIDPTYRSF